MSPCSLGAYTAACSRAERHSGPTPIIGTRARKKRGIYEGLAEGENKCERNSTRTCFRKGWRLSRTRTGLSMPAFIRLEPLIFLSRCLWVNESSFDVITSGECSSHGCTAEVPFYSAGALTEKRKQGRPCWVTIISKEDNNILTGFPGNLMRAMQKSYLTSTLSF
jgi:hypothetical protein